MLVHLIYTIILEMSRHILKKYNYYKKSIIALYIDFCKISQPKMKPQRVAALWGFAFVLSTHLIAFLAIFILK